MLDFRTLVAWLQTEMRVQYHQMEFSLFSFLANGLFSRSVLLSAARAKLWTD